LPPPPAAIGRAALSLLLLAAVACTGSPSTNGPTPGPTPAPTTPVTPDPQAEEKLAVATYCLHAVDAIDSLASENETRFEGALADLEADAESLPTEELRKEARDLARFLDDPENAPKDLGLDEAAPWRLQRTPLTCLDLTGLLSELTEEQRAQLTAPTTRATTSWYGQADTRDLVLSVAILVVPDDECTIHTFPIAGGDQAQSGAYRSDCRTWGKKNPHNFVMVDMTNISTVPPRFRLSDLMALDRSGKVHSPVDVRNQAAQPENFLPAEGTVTSGGLNGFAVFDADELRLRAIAYQHQGVLLIVTFGGKEKSVPPSA
jgi:hypothetical protein